jgi:pimeloyl-ACP methyl ester carboxylesterase
MSLAPRVQFARRADADIAYQLLGDGPTNLLAVPMAAHLEQLWQFPLMSRPNERLAMMSRMVLCELRGLGMSDPLPPGGYAVEELAADMLSVMDAVGFEQAVVLAEGMNGAAAVWLAVHCPERIEGLILYGASCCYRRHPGYEIGVSEADVAGLREVFRTSWGTGITTGFLATSLANDPRLVDEWARYERLMATPSSILSFFDAVAALDVRDLLPQVSARTLVVQPARDGLFPASHGRHLAQHIPGARLVEVDADHSLSYVTPEVLGELAEFLTGTRAAAYTERSLKVVLFTDVVGSTERAAAIGDTSWRHLLSEFRSVVRAVLGRYEAQEVNTRGDDFFVVAASPSVAIETARAIRSEAAALGLDVRTGVHLGEVERQGDDFAGLAVHIGSRIAALAVPGEILISQTVRDALVGSGVEVTARGSHLLKGVPDEWRCYAVAS